MDLDLLRTFLVASDASSLGVAAKKRHVTKSAISQQLKALEAQLGFRLFERVGRHVRPSVGARELAQTLRGVFAQIDDAIELARDAQSSIRGEVRLGAPRPFAAAVLRPRIVRLLETHSDLVLDLLFGTPTELEAKLVGGELDLAVLARAPETDGVVAEELHVETLLAVASPRYLEREGTPRDAQDFANHRVVVFDRDLPMHALWWRGSFGARSEPRGKVVCRAASLDEMRAFAEAGIGIAVLPDYFVKDALERGRLVAIDSRKPVRNAIVLASRKGAVEGARVRAVREALAAADVPRRKK